MTRAVLSFSVSKARGSAEVFPLLEHRSPSRHLGAERAAWAKAAAACRLLERRAVAAALEDPRIFGRATEALFDLVCRSDFLASVVPSGRIPRDFASRCLREAARRKKAIAAEREAILWAGSLAGSRPLTPERIRARLGASTVARLARLAASYPGEPEEGLGPGVLAIPGTRYSIDGGRRLLGRETIPGSGICLGPPVRTREEHGVPTPSPAAGRLGRALAVVDATWAEAGEEVRATTRLVLTREEPGLVSYSHLHRRGVSYIRLRGKTILDLADDLLHEAAHHRLHALEDRAPLFAPARPEDEEVRYFSPWRRELRPLRGIYHAAYTFSFRAELFRRLVRNAHATGDRVGALRLPEKRLRWIADEARNERRQVLRGVLDLEDATRRGLLTPEGRRLLAAIRKAAA